MKAPPIFLVVHVGYDSWTLHGYYFDERQARDHAERLNATTTPSIEYRIEEVAPGDGELVEVSHRW